MDDKVNATRKEESIAQAYAAYLMALAARRGVDAATVMAYTTPVKLTPGQQENLKDR